jgi:hypothetical protein
VIADVIDPDVIKTIPGHIHKGVSRGPPVKRSTRVPGSGTRR